jgi:pimeloyl-ACP methyl ester carboxylesterase
MEFVVELAKAPGGHWEGTFHYVLKEQQRVPVDAVAWDDAVLRFSVLPPGAPEEARAVFDVAVAGDPPWTGTLTQAGQSVDLELRPVPQRPQTPVPPFPYAERDLGFDNPEDGAHLAGTLTIPEGPGPHPAVLLLSGSGAQNRDGALFWHRPFLVLADHFARHGIATLRFDDRGVGESTSSLAEATVEKLARDAVAGVEALAGQPEIDPARIGVLGHSEGASVAALASTMSDKIRFVVHLAGMGLPGGEILVIQEGLIMAAAGVPPEPIAELQQVHRRLHELLLAPDTEPATLREAARAVVERQLGIGATYLGQPAQEVTDEFIDMSVAIWTAPAVMDLVRFDPTPILSQVHCPILALNGTLDLQVPAEQSLANVDRLLAEAGNEQATVRALEGLNHAFQPAQTGLMDEYESVDVTFDPGALALITAWIREQAGAAE